jgi:hypothetical protein
MSFIFRTIFWLTLASVVIPPEARLGGDDGDAMPADLGAAMHDIAYEVWGFGVGLAQTCETNPELCQAGQELISATAETGSSLVVGLNNRWQDAASEAAVEPGQAPVTRGKFQARVE